MKKFLSRKLFFALDEFIFLTILARQSTETALKKGGGYVILSSVVFMTPVISNASTTRGDIPYQTYRDFAENKGQFSAGATNVPVFDKNGNLVDNLNKAPMIDFSSVDVGGIATLVNPQYVISVKHNGGYQSVRFGDGQNVYHLVDRNDQPGRDFHAPRLDKLVTEVTPSEMTHSGMVNGAYQNKNRYSAFYRLGSGTQHIRERNGKEIWISGAYNYLTGGTVGAPWSYAGGKMISTNTNGYLFNKWNQGAMGTHPQAGDSGSPLFAYDTLLGKWVVVGVDSSGGGGGTNWSVIDTNFINGIIQQDTDPAIITADGQSPLYWNFDAASGMGTLEQQSIKWLMHGKKGKDLNAGKNLSFSGKDGVIKLLNSVNQGAGSLTFNNNYTITSDNNSTWIGGGLNISDGATVTWKVNGAKGDNLHKIGAGTLLINASGVNPGGLKIGDGTTILAQKADDKGKVQAFNTVNIASGRARLILADNKQVNPDNISWGYRGGVLDVNGNDLLFHKLNAADYGAILKNGNSKTSNIALNYQISPDSVKINQWSDSKKGKVGSLYIYHNPYSRTTDYFILKTNDYGWFPTGQVSNSHWEYVGHNVIAAKNLVATRYNNKPYVYHGQLLGNLNITNKVAPHTTSSLVLDGSANIDGTFTQENGRLTLQGHPVIHAYNEQRIANAVANIGDHSVWTQPTTFTQNDWENRSFSFGQLELKNSEFNLGRNASLTTNILADNSNIVLGDSRVFIDKKDGDGTDFILQEGHSSAKKESDKSVFSGSVKLVRKSRLNISNVIFDGSIFSDNTSTVVLSPDNTWNIKKDSTIGNFEANNASLSFVDKNWSPKTLTINSINATNLHISMGIDQKNHINDRLNILNSASGSGNTLNLFLAEDYFDSIYNDITLVSAPEGTPYDFFTFVFTGYTPDTEIIEKDGRIFWSIKHNIASGDNSEDAGSSPSLFAGSGTFNFTGAVINSPCNISHKSAWQQVDFGAIPRHILDNGGKSKQKELNITLTGCSAEVMKEIAITFSGKTSYDHTNEIATSGNTNTAIQISQANGKMVNVNEKIYMQPLKNGDNTLHFSTWVKKKSGSDEIFAGDFSAIVDFSVIYQ
ncbi:fimbrial protein [Salmonella enterica]|nr:fimbrial protein [Salmonella enterica]EGM2345322.1 fimbrial protein [Salmonella enterica]EGM2363683.1 fimbrial protein [Salmonella enterica]